jgi:hypothetical protein
MMKRKTIRNTRRRRRREIGRTERSVNRRKDRRGKERIRRINNLFM